MSKESTSRKSTVELAAASAPRPSRIRRDPPPPEKPSRLRSYYSPEQEGWVVVIGVVLFALAIFVISLGVSEYTK